MLEDVANYLNVNHTMANYNEDSDLDYYIFTYNRWNKNANKAYPTVCPKIVKNNAAGRKDLESYIQYMKANKFIVEHVDESSEGAISTVNATVDGAQTSF